MLLPQFPGMTVNPAYARQVLHRSGAAGRCTEGVIEPAARRVSPLPRSTRRAPLIDNASGQSLQTTYAHAGEPRKGSRVRVRSYGSGRERPNGRRGKDAPRHRAECGVAATSEHPGHTWVATGIRPNIRRFSVAVVDRSAPGLDRRLQPIATLRRTRATRGWGAARGRGRERAVAPVAGRPRRWSRVEAPRRQRLQRTTPHPVCDMGCGVVGCESGRGDLNPGPPAPEAGALTGLRYAPCSGERGM